MQTPTETSVRAPEAERPGAAGADYDRTFDRVLFVRHIAIFASAIVAFYHTSRYGIGWTAFAVVTTSAAANFAFSFVHRQPSSRKLAEVLSPIVGVGCWTALASATGGVASPFVAGLWLEIILASGLFAPIGIVSVTLGSVLGLWIMRVFTDVPMSILTPLLHTAFLLGMGALGYAVASRVLRTEAHLVRERDSLDVRLRSLAGQLEQEREVGRLGENVAKLAHGLTNAVHSLRGFATLIEPMVGDRQSARAALDGLRIAIDDLESLARLTLEQGRTPSRGAAPEASSADLGRTLRRAIEEVRLAHPALACALDGDAASDGSVPVAERELFEVLIAVLRNAVEAMGGGGEARVRLRVDAGTAAISVCDTGPGIDPADLERVFEPGFTTKPEGSGYGLFLARRVVEDGGGSLTMSAAEGGGTTVEITLPLVGTAAREAS